MRKQELEAERRAKAEAYREKKKLEKQVRFITFIYTLFLATGNSYSN